MDSKGLIQQVDALFPGWPQFWSNPMTFQYPFQTYFHNILPNHVRWFWHHIKIIIIHIAVAMILKN